MLAGEAFEQVAASVLVAITGQRRAGRAAQPGELAPAFQDVLKALKPGDVSDVLRLAGGYQVIKLEAQTADEVLSAEEARDRIGDALFEQKRQVELKKYLEKLRAQAIIEWKNEEIRKAWESARAAAGAGRAPRPRSRRRTDRTAAPQPALHADQPEPQPTEAGWRRTDSWFAVWTRSRHEQVVRAQLDEKRIEAFLPTLTKWSRWKDRRKQIEVPLFPGYVFAKFGPDRGWAS